MPVVSTPLALASREKLSAMRQPPAGGIPAAPLTPGRPSLTRGVLLGSGANCLRGGAGSIPSAARAEGTSRTNSCARIIPAKAASGVPASLVHFSAIGRSSPWKRLGGTVSPLLHDQLVRKRGER